MWRIKSEIIDEIKKNRIQGNSEQIPAANSKKWYSATVSNTIIHSKHQEQHRLIMLVDESIKALMLSNILPHINTVEYL